MIYEPWSVVAVPFPFTEKAKSKKRPALIISTEKFQKETGHAAFLMITSAKHSAWYGDFAVTDLAKTGLSQDVVVRQKIFTLDLRVIEKSIGALSKKDIDALKLLLKKCLVV